LSEIVSDEWGGIGYLKIENGGPISDSVGDEGQQGG